MSGLNHQLKKKYIFDLLTFYKTSPKHINNSKIKYFLMNRHLYPGTIGYRMIENFFMSKTSLKRGIFKQIDTWFEPFTRQLRDFYAILSRQNIEGKNILKYRNHLTDFYCWLILNDIYDFKNVDVMLCLDYISTRQYASIYAENDIHDFANALEQYFKNYCYKNFPVDLLVKMSLVNSYKHEFGDIEMSAIFRQTPSVKLELLLTIILHLGLSMQVLMKTKVNDLDLYNQCLIYTGSYSGKKLVYPFDHNLKMKIIKLFVLPESDLIFDHESSDCSNHERMYRDFSFALLNARLPAENSKIILRDLHNGVLKGKFFQN